MHGPKKTIWERLVDRQVILLGVVVLLFLSITFFFGKTLFPFFAAVVMAYLMDGMVRVIQRQKVPRIIGVLIVFGLFLFALFSMFLWLIPLLASQLTSLAAELPRIMRATQEALLAFQEKYISGIESQYIQELLPRIARELETQVGLLATQGLQYLPGLLGLFVYLILVPFLILFFLKDKERILEWLVLFIPRERELLMQVLKDVDRQIGNYLRGKFWEVLIMTGATTITFLWLDVRFAVLLGILTGLSTLIPYLGVAVVTVPVVVLVLVQWGFTWGALKPILAYGILQLVDGVLLAPLILGVSVRLHPTAIIFAILICGSIWGYWGVFFAVPIAILVKSLLEFALPYVRGQTPPLASQDSNP